MTSYSEIFNLALRHINDPSLAEWPEEDLSNELHGWLESAIAKLPKLRNETENRDKFDVTNTENLGFHNDLSDITKEVLGMAMAREWLRPMINSTTLTLQAYAKKEGYSQKEHLSGLIALDNKLEVEIQKLLRDDSYTDNDYFD